MPIYEYRCRACGDTAELLRTAADADAPAGCGCGATDSVRLPSLIARGSATGGTGNLPLASSAGPAAGAGAGCCGGGCCG